MCSSYKFPITLSSSQAVKQSSRIGLSSSYLQKTPNLNHPVPVSRKRRSFRETYGDAWQAADELRANSKLSSQEYSVPVLGLIFLKYADTRFQKAKAELEAARAGSGARRRQVGDADYQARGVMVVPEAARYQRLLALPEGANIGMAVNDAMRAIEARNPALAGVLPKTYNRLSDDVLVNLLKHFNGVPVDIEGDAFGRIYEYFLAQFAMEEGRRGGEFFTPQGNNSSASRSCQRRFT